MSEITVTPITVSETIGTEAIGAGTAGEAFADALTACGVAPKDGDILVVSSKVVSLYEGGLIRLADVVPSRKARFLGRVFGKDPHKLQVLMETGRVLLVVPLRWILSAPGMRGMMVERSPNPEAMLEGYRNINNFTFVVRAHATYLDEAGIDHTNSPDGYVTVLPPDPCAAARKIREEIRDRFGAEVAVIVTDTVTCVGRIGSQDIAIGFSGIDPITRATFSDDLFGVPRSGGIDVVIDSIAGLAGLVMGQTTERTPAVLVRGLSYAPEREEDAGRGMGILGYPPGAQGRITFYALVATVWFRLVNLLSFSRWPKRTRSV